MNQVNEKIIEILEKIKKKIKNLSDKLSELDKESLQSQLNQIIEYINEQENIANVISTLEKKLDQTKENYELNLTFSVIPIDSIKKKFTISNEMKKFLEQNIPTDSQGSPIFDRELMEVNENFVHQSKGLNEGALII
jgi:seryl-tRNA synthetase